jgi:hypothetical protein
MKFLAGAVTVGALAAGVAAAPAAQYDTGLADVLVTKSLDSDCPCNANDVDCYCLHYEDDDEPAQGIEQTFINVVYNEDDSCDGDCEPTPTVIAVPVITESPCGEDECEPEPVYYTRTTTSEVTETAEVRNPDFFVFNPMINVNPTFHNTNNNTNHNAHANTNNPNHVLGANVTLSGGQSLGGSTGDIVSLGHLYLSWTPL